MNVSRLTQVLMTKQPEFLPSQERPRNQEPFGLSCLRVAASRTSGNVCISPASLDAVLRVLAEGTSIPDREVTLRRLGPSAGPLENSQGVGYELAYGTALFHDDSIEFLPFFSKKVTEMGAQIEQVPDTLARAASHINGYITTSTLGILHDVVSKKSLEHQQVFLVNALGFKGVWDKEFSKESTRHNYTFHPTPSATTRCDMMFSYDTWASVVESHEYLGVSLKYKAAYNQPLIYFSAFLPQEGHTVDDVLVALQRDGLPDRYKSEKLGSLGLPKFKIEQEHDDLSSMLREVGISTMDSKLFVTKEEYLEVKKSVQAVSIDVDEKGTVAAAATYVIMGYGAAIDPYPKRNIIFDRPFAFFLQTRSDPGHLLFSGIFRNPS